MPDHVSIVNATMIDFNLPSQITPLEKSLSGEVVARLLGYIRPPVSWKNSGEVLRICASYSEVVLKVSIANGEANMLAANLSAEQTQCMLSTWQDLENPRILVDLQAKKKPNWNNTTGSTFSPYHQQSKVGLQHNRSVETPKAFTFEYLEPFANGTCENYKNCLLCLTDSLCGWCDLTSTCLSREVNETEVCVANDHWRYLTLTPSQCSNCSNFISCEDCVDFGECEWWAADAKCGRKGRSKTAIVEIAQCPVPCYQRQNCSSCLNDKGRCVWCEATSQCFSFSVCKFII